MNTITQTMRFRQAVIAYSNKHGVTKAAIRYHLNRQYIYRWRKRYDGTEFTNRLLPKGSDKPILFELELQRLGIRHKLIRPYTPRHNGKVKRSHRKDNEEFYTSHRFYSFEDFKTQLPVRERAYNNFPIRSLSWRSPKLVLFAFPRQTYRDIL